MKARIVLFLMLMMFSVTLAIVIGQRLSEQAMTVAVGVVAGVAASIPTSLLISWMASRMWTSHVPDAMHVEPPEPRVVMVPTSTPFANPTAVAYPVGTMPGYAVQPPPMPRNFQVIGGADVNLESTPPAESVWPH